MQAESEAYVQVDLPPRKKTKRYPRPILEIPVAANDTEEPTGCSSRNSLLHISCVGIAGICALAAILIGIIVWHDVVTGGSPPILIGANTSGHSLPFS